MARPAVKPKGSDESTSWLVMFNYPNSVQRTRLAFLNGRQKDVIQRAREYWPQFIGRMVLRKLKFKNQTEATLWEDQTEETVFDLEPVEPPPAFFVPNGDFVANVEVACVKGTYGENWGQHYELGAPMMTRSYTAAELIEMGYCGVYLKPRFAVRA